MNDLNIIDAANLLPLDERVSIAAFAIMIDSNMDSPADFFNFLAQSFVGDIDFGFIDEYLSEDDAEALLTGIQKSEIIIFLLFSEEVKADYSLEGKIMEHIELFSQNKQSILITNKQINDFQIDFDVIITMPDISTVSLASAIIKLTGKTIEK